MDARPCYFPNYHNFQPTPSQWPLSHVRSSKRSLDDSSDLDTFEMTWVGDQPVRIPYYQRTIRNLTGRSLRESFAELNRKRSQSPSTSPPEPGTRNTPEPRYALRRERASSDEPQPSTSASRFGYQEITSADATNEVKAREKSRPTQGAHGLHSANKVVVEPVDASTNTIKEGAQKPTQHASDAHDTIIANDSNLQWHHRKYSLDKDPRSTPMPVEYVPSSPSRSFSGKIPQSPDINFPRWRPNKTPALRRNSGPAIMSQPSSQVHTQAQINTAGQQAFISQGTAAPPLSPQKQSGDDDDTMNVEESSNPSPATEIKKPKKKSSQQGSHMCKICNRTFTRHFDLRRHNQKHQVETEEDMAPKTCPNCNRILSRVDATKRHVDTLPESCNYLRRQQGLRPLAAMPEEHYAACRAQYYKLAEERKKPKGRKKANRAA